MKFLASPNFNERADDQAISYVMLHYTGMTSAQEAIKRLQDPEAKVSAHYIIEEDGSITQLVDEKLRAWHAGHSLWKGQEDLNSTSIGIELINLGHEFGYQDFPESQLQSLLKLLQDIFKRYNLPPEALIAHSDVAPTRKQDPGEKFPWHAFAEKGFGLWPKETAPINKDDIKNALTKIGYDCQDLEMAITAFQRHYCSEELGTKETKLTRKRLAGLLETTF